MVSKNDSSEKRPAKEAIKARVLALIDLHCCSSGDWYHGKHQRC
jgi:hypothetical protein